MERREGGETGRWRDGKVGGVWGWSMVFCLSGTRIRGLLLLGLDSDALRLRLRLVGVLVVFALVVVILGIRAVLSCCLLSFRRLGGRACCRAVLSLSCLAASLSTVVARSGFSLAVLVLVVRCVVLRDSSCCSLCLGFSLLLLADRCRLSRCLAVSVSSLFAVRCVAHSGFGPADTGLLSLLCWKAPPS